MILGVFGFAVVLAVIVEGLVEMAKTIFDIVKGQDIQAGVLTLVAIAAGLGLAFAAQLHLLGFIGSMFDQTIHPVADLILSGLVIGRGSSYMHDLWKRVQGLADDSGDG